MSCLMTGAAVGGAIAPPLLTIILFLVALICVLRRSGKRNKHEITIQRIPPSMESSLTDVSQMQAFMAPPLSDVNHIYDSIKLPDVGWPQRLQ